MIRSSTPDSPCGRPDLAACGSSHLVPSGPSDQTRSPAEPEPLTGERRTYFSRNERGEILYATHHFTVDELEGLLAAAGFGEISIATERETSSRRPDDAAFFHYATCRA